MKIVAVLGERRTCCRILSSRGTCCGLCLQRWYLLLSNVGYFISLREESGISHQDGGSRSEDSGCILRDHRMSRQTYVSCEEKEKK